MINVHPIFIGIWIGMPIGIVMGAFISNLAFNKAQREILKIRGGVKNEKI